MTIKSKARACEWLLCILSIFYSSSPSAGFEAEQFRPTAEASQEVPARITTNEFAALRYFAEKNGIPILAKVVRQNHSLFAFSPDIRTGRKVITRLVKIQVAPEENVQPSSNQFNGYCLVSVQSATNTIMKIDGTDQRMILGEGFAIDLAENVLTRIIRKEFQSSLFTPFPEVNRDQLFSLSGLKDSQLFEVTFYTPLVIKCYFQIQPHNQKLTFLYHSTSSH